MEFQAKPVPGRLLSTRVSTPAGPPGPPGLAAPATTSSMHPSPSMSPSILNLGLPPPAPSFPHRPAASPALYFRRSFRYHTRSPPSLYPFSWLTLITRETFLSFHSFENHRRRRWKSTRCQLLPFHTTLQVPPPLTFQKN